MSYRGYRIEPPKHHRPDRDVKEITTPSDMIISNGSVGTMAYPCFYYLLSPPVHFEPHSQAHHDHHGWPSPNHPDHICQEYTYYDTSGRDSRSIHHNYHSPAYYHKHGTIHFDDLDAEIHGQRYAHIGSYLDMSKLTPIHLTEEGYNEVNVAILGQPEGIQCIGTIDPDDDWVVRIEFHVNDPTAEEERQEYKFAVRAISEDKTDVLVHGRLIVLPAVLPQ